MTVIQFSISGNILIGDTSSVQNSWMFQLKSNNSNHAKPHMMKDINENYLLRKQ